MKNYLSAAGLQLNTTKILNKIVKKSLQTNWRNPTPHELGKWYQYDVPEVVSGAGCGLKSKIPYQLNKTLKVPEQELSTHPTTQRIVRLNKIVEELQKITGVDWLGIYRKTKNLKGETVLLKEAYYGRFSRAEFPLNDDFAKGSNNSTVGLSGKAIVVNDISTYPGPYYTCDVQVKSEFCLPILGENNQIIGIIDAEAFVPQFFTKPKLLEIAKVAFDLGRYRSLFLET